MTRYLSCVLLGFLISGGISSAESREVVAGGQVSHPVWDVTLQIPSFEIMDEHPLRGQANFLLAGSSSQGGCDLTISMFAIPVEYGSSASECREGYAGNPVRLKKQQGITLLAHESAPVTYTRFEQEVVLDGMVQNQLYGYWTRGETCFELHISSMECASFTDLALPILRSVQIPEHLDVTLETVMMAAQNDSDPSHWNVHLQVAGLYLHAVEEPDTQRARRFYGNAMRLGQGSMEPQEMWLIEAGMGLSWLMEDEGSEAIPYLARAMKVARDNPSASKGLDETIYNFACANALAGKPVVACDHLASLLATQSKAERKKTLTEIRKDPQLKAVKKADCFDELKSLAKKR